MAHPRRDENGAVAVIVGLVDVDAVLDQQLDELELAMLRRDGHGGDAAVVGLIDIGVVLDQQLNDLDAAELPAEATPVDAGRGGGRPRPGPR